MSADNGIYILQTKDGYRVTEAQAIENIYWDEEKKKIGDKINLNILIDYFGDCKVFDTKNEAMNYAENIYNEIIQDDICPIVEYGIQIIDELKQVKFPKKEKNNGC